MQKIDVTWKTDEENPQVNSEGISWDVNCIIRHVQLVQIGAGHSNGRKAEGCHYQDTHCLCTIFKYENSMCE